MNKKYKLQLPAEESFKVDENILTEIFTDKKSIYQITSIYNLAHYGLKCDCIKEIISETINQTLPLEPTHYYNNINLLNEDIIKYTKEYFDQAKKILEKTDFFTLLLANLDNCKLHINEDISKLDQNLCSLKLIEQYIKEHKSLNENGLIETYKIHDNWWYFYNSDHIMYQIGAKNITKELRNNAIKQKIIYKIYKNIRNNPKAMLKLIGLLIGYKTKNLKCQIKITILLMMINIFEKNN